MITKSIKDMMCERIDKHVIKVDISEQIAEKAKEILIAELANIRVGHQWCWDSNYGDRKRDLDIHNLIDNAIKESAKEQLSDVNLHKRIERYIEKEVENSINTYVHRLMEKYLKPLLQERHIIKQIIKEINDYQVK